jgi:hypothetical protein
VSEAQRLSVGTPDVPFADRDRPAPASAPGAAAPAPGAARGPSFHGRQRFFTYSNRDVVAPPSVNTCGQQAMAAILDFWGTADFGLPRNYRGSGPADDGALHHPPPYVNAVMRRFPPSSFAGITFASREDMVEAFEACGLKVGIAHSAAFGSGIEQEAELREWIAARRLPAICLMDNSRIWGKDGVLHWGIICGFSSQEVLLASWAQMRAIPWPQFRAAWHCQGLPWPNNFLALYPHRPA